jgi:quercetin dioxygenase-like cupin family protein
MAIYRFYTGNDGEAHVEEITDPNEIPELRSRDTQGIISFRYYEKGGFLDFHPAPSRRLLIILSGEAEVGLGDGTVVRMGPGDMRIYEDTTGHGHTTRYLESGVAAYLVPNPPVS